MTQPMNYGMHYQRMEVSTADPFELLLILYKGAIHKLNEAKTYLDTGQVEKRVISINKAVAMIGELQTALDFEKGQDIAVSLDRLYVYMLQRLTTANVRQEKSGLDEVIKLLTMLQSTWEEARILHRRQDADIPAPHAVAGGSIAVAV